MRTSGGCQSEMMVSTFIFLLNSRCCRDREMSNLRHMLSVYIWSRAQERKSPESYTGGGLTFLIIASDFRTLKLRARKIKKKKRQITLVKDSEIQLQRVPQCQQCLKHEREK